MSSVELIITGNGPGELAGWVRPVARAARELAASQRRDLALTLMLTPSQFAGGREQDVVRGWDLFDRIIDPPTSVRLALGVGGFSCAPQAALVHLGGDLWFSARLARRLGVPAGAFAETTLIARRHRPFARIFAASQKVRDQLVAKGIPANKIEVTGDPRVDAVLWEWRNDEGSQPPHPHPLPQGGEGTKHDQPHPLPRGGEGTKHDHPHPQGGEGTKYDLGDRLVVSFMPSSRDYLFRALVPYFLTVAEALAVGRPGTDFQMIVSPFLSAAAVEDARRIAAQRWPHLTVTWIENGIWPALSRSDFVLTIPGTNTLELAVAGVPFGVVMPAELIDHLRLEGVMDWITRLPWLGRRLKFAVALRALTRQRYVALPNLKTGAPMVPEWIGSWPPPALAERLDDWLRDDRRRTDLGAQLRALYTGAEGASQRIASLALALADRRVGAAT